MAELDKPKVHGQASLLDNPLVQASRASQQEAAGFIDAALEKRIRRSIQAPDIALQASTTTIVIRGVAGIQREEAKSPHDALLAWVDLDKARVYADEPAELLRAVAHHHRHTISAAFEAEPELSLLEDTNVLDEAALLYHELHSDEKKGGLNTTAQAGTVRSTFMAALRADYEKQRHLEALFAPPAEPERSAPFFDGFALRNANGKTFDQLLASPDTFRSPLLQTLSAAQKRALLEAKFAQMGLSMQYAIGTVDQALASTIMRAQRYQRVVETTRFTDQAELLRRFRGLEEQFAHERASSAVNPRLLFALLLARSSGVDIGGPDELFEPYVKELLPRLIEEGKNGNVQASRWAAGKLAMWNDGGIAWRDRDLSIRVQAVQSLMNELHASIGKGEPVSEVAAELKRLGAFREWIVGTDWKTKALGVLAYSNERLMAAYGTPPQFDRTKAAADILLEYGMDEEEMEEERLYVIQGDSQHISESEFGDRVDEFLTRADWSGLSGSMMRVAGQRIKPRDELQRAEEAFNDSMAASAWVIAKAKENLRARSQPLAQSLIDEEAARIAKAFKTETETHRNWMRGFHEWINMVPVVGPIYNIEEGVRHKDALQIVLGILFLGLDVFDFMGAGAGEVGEVGARGAAHEAAPREHAAVSNVRHAAGSIDVDADRVATNPLIVEAGIDPVHIGQRDAHLPEGMQGIAARVRAGETDLTWHGYDVVLVRNENRVALVEHAGGSYHEVDCKTRARVRNAPLIHRDAQTGVFRSGGGLRGGMRDEMGLGRDFDLESRYTVDKVSSLMKVADDTRVRDFDEIFDDGFDVAPPDPSVSTFDAREFYRKLYDTSSTFRRLMNNHADSLDDVFVDSELANARDAAQDSAGGAPTSPTRWKIVASESDASRAGNKAYTDFDRRQVRLPSDADIAEMSYQSASGVETTTREQAYLHEMVHAMTGARDPERAVDMLNRGPVVYLTDKILSEAGYSIPEQVMYRRTNFLPESDLSPHDTVEFHREAAAVAARVENRHLDRLVDRKSQKVAADTLVEGVPVSSRQTVEDTKLTFDRVHATEAVLDFEEFTKKFDELFAFAASNRGATAEVTAMAQDVTRFFNRLHERSPTFRALFEEMPDVHMVGEWQFVLERRVALAELPAGKAGSCVNRASHRIYVFDDDTMYLSPEGLREVERERALARAMVCVMTGLGRRMPPAEAFMNRGADVVVAERILSDAGYNLPQQLVAGLAVASDEASMARLLSYQTSAQRSVAVEDRYLQSLP
jgi:phosphoribosylanthranilate isomerase